MIGIKFSALHSSGHLQHLHIDKVDNVEEMGLESGFEISITSRGGTEIQFFLTCEQLEELREAIGFMLSID